MTEAKSSGTGLRIIAIGKLAKVIALVTIGVLTLSMRSDPSSELKHWGDVLRLDPGNHYLHHAIEAVSGVSPHRLHELSLGTFVYAALFATEGLGLWFQKTWAEYLTIVITLSFIPLEVYEIVHHASASKVVMLVLNAAALAYLVVRVLRERRERREETRHLAPAA